MPDVPLIVSEALFPLVLGDEYVEITRFGQAEPEYLVARRADDIAEAKARRFYLDGLMTLEQFEQAIEAIVKYRNGGR